MNGLIQKSGYIKNGSGGAGNYMRYIATRDGVELLTNKPGHQESDKYMKYIAERPRSHGLFNNTPDTPLAKTMSEVNDHSGPVWTFVFSLKREDAARLGYDNAASWQRLIKAHQAELAEAMKIPPNQFRWCAAFHDEKHHPHIHMMVWSADPKQGYLTERGIEKMRSKLNNDIFQDEMLSLYQQKEFKAIKNAVIRVAENIYAGKFTFEDEWMAGEVDEDAKMLSEQSNSYQLARIYQDAKNILYSDESTETEKEIAVQTLERLWDAGFSVAAHQIGKCWRDGRGVLPDDERAEMWFRRSAEAGYDFSQYALAKLLQSEKHIAEAVSWFERATAQGNQYATYLLGKLYLTGDGIPKDIEKAIDHLTTSAQEGNPYAQYALGKLYLAGQEVPHDQNQAGYWLAQSAAQGSEYAQFLLCHVNQTSAPNLLLCATKLLHHIGNVFQDNCVPPVNPASQHVDRKLRRQIREKKITAGHKPDDHEEQGYIGPAL